MTNCRYYVTILRRRISHRHVFAATGGRDAEEDAPDQEGQIPNIEVPEQRLPVDGLRRLDRSNRDERFGNNQSAAVQS